MQHAQDLDPGGARHGVLRRRPRQHDRVRGAAVDRRRARVRARRRAVGAQRLPRDVRRAPAVRGAGRRPARPPPGVPRGHRDLHGRVGGLRLGGRAGGARRRSRPAGGGRGRHGADGVVAGADDVRARTGAQPGARRLGRDRRGRRHRRAAAGRADHAAVGVAVDLPGQPAGRRPAAGGVATAAPEGRREAGRPALLRRGRRGDRDRVARAPGPGDHGGVVAGAGGRRPC